MLIHQKRDPQWEWSFLFTDKIPFKNLKASNGFVLKKTISRDVPNFQGERLRAIGPLVYLLASNTVRLLQ